MRWCPALIVLTVSSVAVAGPDWTEIPDASKLPPGQVIPFSPVDSITGMLVGLDAAGGPDVADLFQVTTTIPNTTVKTGSLPLRNSDFDTIIVVFTQAGVGVVANDDVAPGHTSSAVTIPTPGTYLIGIAAKGVQPVSQAGNMFDLYLTGNQFAQLPPTSAGMLPVQDWVGQPIDPEPRNYMATLDQSVIPPIPVLSDIGLFLLAGGFAAAGWFALRRFGGAI